MGFALMYFTFKVSMDVKTIECNEQTQKIMSIKCLLCDFLNILRFYEIFATLSYFYRFICYSWFYTKNVKLIFRLHVLSTTNFISFVRNIPLSLKSDFSTRFRHKQNHVFV